MTSGAVWVIGEQAEGVLRECTLEVLGEGRRLADQLDERLEVILIGDHMTGLVDGLAGHRVDRVYLVEHRLLASYNLDGYVAALEELIADQAPFLVLINDTPNGGDFAPRLAARLRTSLVTGCVIIKLDQQREVKFIKPTHQGKIYSTITCSITAEKEKQIPYLATIRPGAIGVDPPGDFKPPEVIRWKPQIKTELVHTRTVQYIKGDPKQIDLREADLIVAGGRGVDDSQGWRMIEELGEILGASVGGTRMATDMGLISSDRMIGQTGKNVKPKLYFAAGISGEYYHLRGIDSELIIAINKDRNAPIFIQSKLGIVADLREILPDLCRKLSQEDAGSG